eukprot:GHVS01039038.1.p1 GENE.GHVS01039038.1~~GHVS01039038.1.p1  ORF type:complete len:517 (-),score=103.59 GHVS01039038.1:311-1861(-)
MSSEDNRDILTLKVMRLAQPQIDPSSCLWPPIAPDELFHHTHNCTTDRNVVLGNKAMATAATTHTQNTETGVGCVDNNNRSNGGGGDISQWLEQTPALLLPSTQGYIFTGELFHAYLNLMNSSHVEALTVSVQVELQTNLHSHLLFDNSVDPLKSLTPGNCFDFSIAHRLAEQSAYELSCTVSYQLSALGKPKTLRKSYRFNAQRPFSISHLTAHLPIHSNSDGSSCRGGGSLVEVHLENASSSCVWLNDVSVICGEGIAAKRIQPNQQQHNDGYNNTTTTTQQQQRCVNSFKPKDKFSVIFALSPKPPQAALDAAYLQRVYSFGYLQLQWRTAVGGQGAMCDYNLINQRTVPAESLELRVASCPSTVKLEEAFTVVVELINRDVQTLCPKLRVVSELLTQHGKLQLHGVETEEANNCAADMTNNYTKNKEIWSSEIMNKQDEQEDRLRVFTTLSNDRSVCLQQLEGGSSRRMRLRFMALQQGFCKLSGLYITADNTTPPRCTDASACLCDLLVVN